MSKPRPPLHVVVSKHRAAVEYMWYDNQPYLEGEIVDCYARLLVDGRKVRGAESRAVYMRRWGQRAWVPLHVEAVPVGTTWPAIPTSVRERPVVKLVTKFEECSVCDAKPGSPDLCQMCLARRNMHSRKGKCPSPHR